MVQFRVSHSAVSDDRNGVVTDANANYSRVRDEGKFSRRNLKDSSSTLILSCYL